MSDVVVGVAVVVVVVDCSVDGNSFCSVTFSSLSSSSTTSSVDGLANLKVGLFLLEKSSLDLIDGAPSPLMGKLGKFLPDEKSIFAGLVGRLGRGVVGSSSDPITILLLTVELMKRSWSAGF